MVGSLAQGLANHVSILFNGLKTTIANIWTAIKNTGHEVRHPALVIRQRPLVRHGEVQEGAYLVRYIRGLQEMAGGGTICIPVYVGGTLLDEVVVDAQARQNLRSGGR